MNYEGKPKPEPKKEDLIWCPICKTHVDYPCEDTDFCDYYDHPDVGVFG